MAKTIFSGNITQRLSLSEYGRNQTVSPILTKEAIVHAQMIDEFLEWVKRDYNINAWWRSSAYNKKVGGHPQSNHLKGTATDISFIGISTKEKFDKYGKKWEEICKKYKVIGEFGLYPTFFHFGSHITYTKKFTRFTKM